MPDLSTQVQTQFGQRRGTKGAVLIWFDARVRATGAAVTLGLWTGEDTRQFGVEGQTRTYIGAGSVIEVPPIKAMVGLNVIMHQVVLPPFTPEMRTALIQYDIRRAKAEIHAVPFDIDTNQPMGDPIRMVKGRIEQAPTTLGLKRSATSKTTIKIASRTRQLTSGLPIYRSLDAHQEAYPNDKGREHTAVAGNWPVLWGDS